MGDPVEGGLRDVPFGLEGLDPLFQVDVQVDKPVLKGTIKAVKFVLFDGQFGFQGRTPVVNGPILVRLSLNERFEDAGEAFWREQLLLDVVDDESVEFADWNMPAPAYGLSFLMTASAAVTAR